MSSLWCQARQLPLRGQVSALSRGADAKHGTPDSSPKEKPTKSAAVAVPNLLRHRALCGELNGEAPCYTWVRNESKNIRSRSP